jgi:ER-bound oxygenase mpaB/B'/Rubber oxygenase, catalytic domain
MLAESQQHGGQKAQKWSHSFTWTDKHLDPQLMQSLRHEYDQVGAQVLDRILAIGKKKNHHSDFYKLLEQHHNEDKILTRFWEEVHTVPKWVDWDQLERGQEFFYRYALANMIGFALQGFICENSASTGVVEVLVRTGGFSTRALWGRLLETFQWLLQVTHDIESMKPGGEGFKSTIRVRLLHSSVRRRLLELASRRPDYYNPAEYGIPVNTMDSIHSIATFACNPMFLQLPKMGIRPRPHEIEDYLALFRYIAYVIGARPEYFSTPKEAKAVMESCYYHELRMTETSQIVAYNFLGCVESLPSPLTVSRRFIEAGSRWLNGHEVCDELYLGRPGILSYIAFTGLCATVAIVACVQRIIPALDRFMVQVSKPITTCDCCSIHISIQLTLSFVIVL